MSADYDKITPLLTTYPCSAAEAESLSNAMQEWMRGDYHGDIDYGLAIRIIDCYAEMMKVKS